MDDERPLIESRGRRALAYLRHNGPRMVVDTAVLLAWILAATTVFDWLDLPTWFRYVVLFAGVVVYTRITPTWERPYRSPS